MGGLEGLACTQCYLNWHKALLLLCLLTKGILSNFKNLQNLLDLCRTKVTEGLCLAKILLTLLLFSPQPVVQCTESSPCVHRAGDPGDAWRAGKSTECCGKFKSEELFKLNVFRKQEHCGGHSFWGSQPTLFKCGGSCDTVRASTSLVLQLYKERVWLLTPLPSFTSMKNDCWLWGWFFLVHFPITLQCMLDFEILQMCC